jgi:hypothetical protein
MAENTNGLDCLFPQILILALGFLSSCLVFYLLQFIILKKTIYSYLLDSSMVCSLLLTAEVVAAHASLTHSWAIPPPAAAKAD